MKVNNGGGRTATKENHTNAYLRLQSLSAFKTVSIRKDFKMTRIIIGIRYNHIPDSRPLLLENSNLFNLHVSMFINKLASDPPPPPPGKFLNYILDSNPNPTPGKKSGCLHE